MINIMSNLFSGILFGIGLAVSGMLNPFKVQSFLDFFGSWDPSLAFVMLGAIMTTTVGYRFIFKLQTPLFSDQFFLPLKKDIDQKLLVGSAFFGIGWGVGGLCPGPSIALILSSPFPLIIFVISMFFGIWVGTRVKFSNSGD